MFRYKPYAFLSAVGSILGALLLAAPAGAGWGDIGITNNPDGDSLSRGGHTVQENIPPKPPVDVEDPDPPNAPAGPVDWISLQPPEGFDPWRIDADLTGLIFLPTLPDRPTAPIDLIGRVGPDLTVALPQYAQATGPLRMNPIPAPGALTLLGLGALAMLGRRRR
jgi:uncharacterized protein (TIGR03382 family)